MHWKQKQKFLTPASHFNNSSYIFSNDKKHSHPSIPFEITTANLLKMVYLEQHFKPLSHIFPNTSELYDNMLLLVIPQHCQNSIPTHKHLRDNTNISMFLTLAKICVKTLSHLDFTRKKGRSVAQRNCLSPVWLGFDPLMKC